MNPPLVFDVGMHVGQDTAFYLHRGCSVVAVEANPVLADDARRRFHDAVADGRLRVENVGISESEGSAEFWICDDKLEWSSFHREVASRRAYRHHSIQIPCTTLDRLFAKHGVPFYAKIDIEGNDRLCLAQLSPELSPPFVSVESYGEQTIPDLRKLGYSLFKVVDQISFCPVEDPPAFAYSLFWALRNFRDRSLRERSAYFSRLAGKLGGRRLADFAMRRFRSFRGFPFPDGASGPFGDDTPGRWLSADDALRAISAFHRWMESSGLSFELRWFDIHAKKS